MTRHLSVVPVQAQPAQGHPAGLVTRSLAAVVDGAVVAVVLVAMWIGWNALRFLWNPRGFAFGDTHVLLGFAAGWALSVLYLTGAWALTGRTYGAHLMGLRVVDRRGRKLRLWVALLRAVLYTTVPIGLLWSARGGTHASLQDVVVGSRVVYAWQGPAAGPTGRSSAGDEASAGALDEPGARHEERTVP